MGGKDAAKEVVPEEAVNKDVADEVDASNDQYTQHQSETSWDKWMILARF